MNPIEDKKTETKNKGGKGREKGRAIKKQKKGEKTIKN
jgi:hypothetical protein